jgi:hypothetical protein
MGHDDPLLRSVTVRRATDLIHLCASLNAFTSNCSALAVKASFPLALGGRGDQFVSVAR